MCMSICTNTTITCYIMTYMHITYVYMHIHIDIHTYIYIYIHIEREIYTFMQRLDSVHVSNLGALASADHCFRVMPG